MNKCARCKKVIPGGWTYCQTCWDEVVQQAVQQAEETVDKARSRQDRDDAADGAVWEQEGD